MKIRKISLEEALLVRHTVLWPDNPIEFCIVDGDDDGLHIGAEIDGTIVSVASVYINNTDARLRKFATYPSFQRQGIGSALISHTLEYLKNNSVSYFWCDARESALSFYQRFGMNIEGERFYKNDVAYFRLGLVLNHSVKKVTA